MSVCHGFVMVIIVTEFTFTCPPQVGFGRADLLHNAMNMSFLMGLDHPAAARQHENGSRERRRSRSDRITR
jgi:hypothetical protein